MITPERAAQMYASLDDEERRCVRVMLDSEHERVQKLRRPVLRLIKGGPPVATPRKCRAAARTKKKEPA